MTPMTDPRRGEVWWADLEPTKGQEISKVRPVLVVSGDSFRALAIRMVVPITGLTVAKMDKAWLVPLRANATNGLSKDSVADVLQARGLSTARFSKRLGRASAADVAEVAAALALVVEAE